MDQSSAAKVCGSFSHAIAATAASHACGSGGGGHPSGTGTAPSQPGAGSTADEAARFEAGGASAPPMRRL